MPDKAESSNDATDFEISEEKNEEHIFHAVPVNNVMFILPLASRW